MKGVHILDALLAHAASEPDRTAYIFVSDGHQEQRITRGELRDRMCRVATNLLRLCPVGSRVALLLPQGAEYVVVFWACLYAGLVPVPLYPSGNAAVRARLAGILKDSGAAIVIGADACASDPRHVPIAALLMDADLAPMAVLTPATLAYLQYSSGSSGAPKGVRISHTNIMANLDMIATAADVRKDDVFVNWLPLHHDLGLVNTVLLPAASGALSVLFTPLSFMRNPLSWLTRIARYGGTISGGPNFAYQAVLDRMHLRSERAAALLAGLDLRHWRVAFNAAEPIQAATQQAFASALQTIGFKPETFFAAYGMAEATVFVSGGAWNQAREASTAERRDAASAARNATVGCGLPNERQVLVVDSCGRPAMPGVEGEIWIRGDHVSEGYFYQDNDAQSAFQRYTADGDGPFFATGDSGALEDGHLYVLGRIKDIIIQNGRNIYPADVEQVVVAMLASDTRFGACAAIGRRQGGTEAVQLVLESRSAAQDDDASLMQRISAHVFDEHGVLLDAIAVVPPGSIDKTSSGKIRRQALRHAFECGKLSARYFHAQYNESVGTPAVDARLEKQLAEVLSGLADVAVDDPHRSFFAYGISSLHLTQLVAELAPRPAMAVTMQQVLEHPTLRRLANLIANRESVPAPAKVIVIPADPLMLSSNQQMMLSIDAWAPGNPAYHLPLVLALDGDADPLRLARAAQQTLTRYEILRTVYHRDGVSHQASVLPADSISIDVEQLDAVSMRTRLHVLVRQGFDLEREPPVRGVVLVDADARQVVLGLVLHHVAADGWSLRLLAERLLRRYAGLDLSDDDQVANVAHVVDVDLHRVSHASYAQALTYWRRALAGLPDVHSLPLDKPRAPARGNGVLGRHRIRLDAQAVAGIRRLCATVHSTVFSGIHALLALTLARIGNERDVVLGAFLSGRDSAQRQTQIGFLAHTTLLRTSIDLDANLAAVIRLCSDTLREAQRHAALSYLDLLRELKPARDPGYNPLFQISLNYHDYGNTGLPEGLAARHVELDGGVARYDLAVEAYPEDGTLRIDFDYDATLFESGTIARLAAMMQALLGSALRAPATPAGLLPGHSAPALPPDTVPDVSLYRRFHEVAIARPKALALRHRQHSLSYGELLSFSAALATAISSHAAPGERVLIFMQRTPCYVLGILATLRLDCTYVPLDPDYYQDALAGRIDFIAPACMLVDAGTATLLPPASGVPVINVEAFIKEITLECMQDPTARSCRTGSAELFVDRLRHAFYGSVHCTASWRRGGAGRCSPAAQYPRATKAGGRRRRHAAQLVLSGTVRTGTGR
jgi:acyl-CoA synthetase (AMP-forming)/AMP-acid ligase II